MYRRLYRSATDEVVAGVCGGLGQYLDVDPALVRVVTVILFFASWGTALVAYIVAWIIIPREEYVPPQWGEKSQQQSAAPPPPPSQQGPIPRASTGWQTVLPGIVLICLGVLIVLRENYFWFSFGDVWPIILILCGVGLIVFRGLNGTSRTDTEPATGDANGSGSGNGHNGGGAL